VKNLSIGYPPWVRSLVYVTIFLFLPVLGFELSTCTTWTMPPDLLCFSYFSDQASCFCQAGLDCDPPATYASYPAGITDTQDMHHHSQLVCWDGISWTFCLGWPWTTALPISASQGARIADVSHHTQPVIFAYSKLIWVYLAIYGL
jgi:hypothetical protein